jgi:hypothetical protein
MIDAFKNLRDIYESELERNKQTLTLLETGKIWRGESAFGEAIEDTTDDEITSLRNDIFQLEHILRK